MYRRGTTWTAPVQNPKLQELDELASAMYALLRPVLNELQATLDARRKGLTAKDIAAAIAPFLVDERIQLHKLLGSMDAVSRGVAHLFASASGGRPMLFETFRVALNEAHARHFERCAQRPTVKWRCALTHLPLTDLQELLPCVAGTLCLADDADCRRAAVLRQVHHAGPDSPPQPQWEVDSDASAALVHCLAGFTTAVTVVPVTGFPVFSQVDNLGATLVWVDGLGKPVMSGPLNSHATALQWLPPLQRVVCGTALGDISTWTYNGRKDPDGYAGHNGPVVKVGCLEQTGLLASVGADGKAVLLNPSSMTPLRSVTADESFRCAAFSSPFNLIAAGGFTNLPMLINASLPPRSAFVALEHDANPHDYVIVDVMFHRDQLASLDGRGVVKLWDLRTLRCVDTVETAAQRDTVMEKLLPHGPAAIVVSGSATRVLEVDLEVRSSNIVRADEHPIVSVALLGLATFVTVSTQAIKLWSARTGELLSQFAGFSKSRIACATMCHETGEIFAGHENGAVSRLVAGQEVVHGANRHAAAVSDVAVVHGLLLSFDAAGQCLVSAKDRLGESTMVEGMPLARIVRTAVPSFVPMCLTAMTARAEIVFVDLADDGPTPIEDVREYDLGAVLRNGRPANVAYALLQSLGLVCVADGPDLSIVGIHSGRATRLLAWPSHGSEVVDVAYLPLSDRSLLASVELSGTTVVYNITPAMEQLRFKPGGFLEVTAYAPVTTCLFPATRLHLTLRLARVLLPVACVIVATEEQSVAVHRLDGVHIGDLDMFRSGATTWLPVGGQKGSAYGNMVQGRGVAHDDARVHAKHCLALGADHPIVGDATAGGAARARSPERVASPVAAGPRGPALRELQSTALVGQTRHAHTTVAVSSETSARTLTAIDVGQSRWTVDNEAVRQRDAKKTLVHMRLLTQEMNPSREVLAGAQSRMAMGPASVVQAWKPKATVALKRPHRLMPLHISAPADLGRAVSSPFPFNGK